MSRVVRRSVWLNYNDAKKDMWIAEPPKISSSKLQSQNQGHETKFEEIWLGLRQPVQTQSQWKHSSESIEASSGNREMNDSMISPLPMSEDSCVLNLEAFMTSSVASSKFQRMNMPSKSLFNDCTDHQKSQVQTTGTNSPFNELTSNVCSEDAWNLLEEFEAITDIDNNNIVTLPPPTIPLLANPSANNINYNAAMTMIEMENIDILKLETVFDAFPDLPQLDELIQLTSPESSSLDSGVLAESTFQPGFDAENNTTDILAHLITDTILSDSELEGLFSNTMLDFNTVLGQTYYTDTDLVNVDHQSMQEVPQVSITESPKRPLDSVDDRLKAKEENSTSSEPQTKKKKLVSTSPSSSACPSPSLSSDCNDDQLHNLKYTLMRQKNNEASKKSRSMRKQKHRSMEQEVSHLEQENKRLRDKAEQLEKTVTTLKTSLMKHILDLKNQK